MRNIMWMTAAIVLIATGASAPAAISDPTALTGLQLWLDANDLDGDGTAEGAGESYIGGTTATWADKSGVNNDFIQTAVGDHASQSLGALNSLETLTFSGTDHFTGPAGVLTAGDDDYTYIAVWNSTGLTSCCGSVYEQGSGVHQRAAMLQIGSNYGFNGESNDANIVPNTLNQWKIVDLQVDNNSASNIQIYEDGTFYSGATGNPAALNVAANGTAVGKKVGVTSEYFQGQIAEIIVYDRTLTFEEHVEVSDYLNNKWNLSASFPEGLDALRHRWSFNDGTMDDSIGSADGVAENGNVFVSGGELNITGAGRMLTSTIGQAISEKTLVVWTTLTDEFFSSKGSALTLENDANGGVFDGIVYGEINAAQWMAGSDGFARTDFPQTYGFAETNDGPGKVMIAIVYNDDNSIDVYRDGILYGSYAKGSLVDFDMNAVVQIGRRHGTTTADTYIGTVNEARIYADALSLQQIQGLFAAGPDSIVLIPTPAALPAGLALLTLVVTRRRR